MHEKVFEDASRSGYVRVRVDGSMYDLSEKIELDKNIKHSIDIVVDRLVMQKESIGTRLTDSIETAASLAGGMVRVVILNPDGTEEELTFSQNYACKTHGISLGELAPRMFSFNSPFGACPDCDGLGESFVVSPDLVIPDKNLSLFERRRSWSTASRPSSRAAIPARCSRRWERSTASRSTRRSRIFPTRRSACCCTEI